MAVKTLETKELEAQLLMYEDYDEIKRELEIVKVSIFSLTIAALFATLTHADVHCSLLNSMESMRSSTTMTHQRHQQQV